MKADMLFRRIAPAKTPVSFPTPPYRLPPPITTAAIASNNMPIPTLGEHPFILAASSQPAKADRTPLNIKTPNKTLLTLVFLLVFNKYCLL